MLPFKYNTKRTQTSIESSLQSKLVHDLDIFSISPTTKFIFPPDFADVVRKLDEDHHASQTTLLILWGVGWKNDLCTNFFNQSSAKTFFFLFFYTLSLYHLSAYNFFFAWFNRANFFLQFLAVLPHKIMIKRSAPKAKGCGKND